MKKCGIDSFTVWIKLDIFTYYNENLIRRVVEVYEKTGEILQEHDRKPIFVVDDGVKYRACIKTPFGQKPVMELTINSRMLKEKYYINGQIQTITKHNFYRIFKDLSATIGFECDYFDFLEHSIVFDVDLCRDFHANNLVFESLCRSIASHPFGKSFYIKLDGNYLEKASVFTGAQFGKRDQSKLSKPFLKYYTKYWEYIHRSSEFHQKYCPMFVDEHYRRFEGQVKNLAHWRSIARNGVLPLDFADGSITIAKILSLSSKQIKETLDVMLEKYQDIQHIAVNGVSTKSPATDYLLMRMTYLLMKEGFTLEQCLDELNNWSDNQTTVIVSKSRLRLRLKRAYKLNFTLKNLIITDDDIMRDDVEFPN